MFLPIGDTPKPRNFVPVVTWGFIALNLIVYLLVTFPLSVQAVDPRDPALLDYLRHLGPRLPARIDLRGLSVYDLFVFEHGYKPAAPSLASLFSSMFLHGGFLHLAGNMLFLGIYGRNVEHRLGRIGYLVGYLGSGVVATLAFSLLTGPSWSPLVGASGAIAGVLGGLGGGDPYVALAVVFAACLVMTNVITNAAAATFMFPIAVSIAGDLGVSFMPFAAVLMLGTSYSFINPAGYQTNLMVLGPGGYRTIDYVRVGLPLTVVVGAVVLLLTPLAYGL